jgi:hypothetical protein
MSKIFQNLISSLPECLATPFLKNCIKIIKLPGAETQTILVERVM